MSLDLLFLELFNYFQPWGSLFLDLWWLWLFIALAILTPQLWLTYARESYKKANSWMLLEFKVPREVRRNPRAMEQVFMAMHAVRNSPSNFEEKWWDGEVALWYSCEVVSFGGEIHFYMWVPRKHRNIMEATLYAQYPDIEIDEVEDYITRLPPTYAELSTAGYQLFGNELALEKPDVYPIRTYTDFEEKEEEWQLDPVAALLETLAKVKPQEHLWVQIVVRPTLSDAWREEGERELANLKLKARTLQKVTDQGVEELLGVPSPGEVELMKAIDRNVGKPGFETFIRYIYISPKDLYDSNFGQRAVFSAFNQYASVALNRFRNNFKVWTRASKWFLPYVFPTKRVWARRVKIYESYRARRTYSESFTSSLLNVKAFHFGIKAERLYKYILNVEELATIFHLPTNVVLTGPLIKRVEARKVGPPAGLPIYGDGKDELPLPQ